LQDAGFQILQISPITINIAASRETYERAFRTTIVAEERPVIKEVGVVADNAPLATATYLDSPDTALPGLIATGNTPFADVLEGVALEEPRYLMEPSPFPPSKAYWHLRLPADLALACNAERAHRGGITGRGVKVAIVDTGHYRHPFFTAWGYRVAPVILAPGAQNPLSDEVGHGTGKSANILALAPDAELMPVKWSHVNSVAAFNTAFGLSPHIINCSWGSHKPGGPLSAADQALAAAITLAVASGVTVIFPAGNGHAAFPGQHPDVIAAGGVYMDSDESLQASNYASGFISSIYPNRRVPDLCGLVGLRPRAIYLMLPVQPNNKIDKDKAGASYPDYDETTENDGWAAFSGASAAAAQLAGTAALVKQAAPGLSPLQVKEVLMKTARDVTKGSCNAVPSLHDGLQAIAGPDTATGNGLLDAHKAVMLAKVRNLGQPATPQIPASPASTTGQVTSFWPPMPRQDFWPPMPPRPGQDFWPPMPPRPGQDFWPPMPPRPGQDFWPPMPPRPGPGFWPPPPPRPKPVGEPESPGQPEPPSPAAPPPARLSAEDVEALEKLITEDEFDPDE
jgi:hypothetical protein